MGISLLCSCFRSNNSKESKHCNKKIPNFITMDSLIRKTNCKYLLCRIIIPFRLIDYRRSTIIKEIAYDNVKILRPTSVDSIANCICYAKDNGFKITTISGGHSHYFMKNYPKLHYEKLIVIDTSKMTKIKKIDDNIINIQAGVTSGMIRKFNKKLKNQWCLYGHCDTVGLGFWINGGQFSGINWYGAFKKGVCGSDMIQRINYIDADGKYQSIDKSSGKIFGIMKMIAGGFGVIVSLDIKLISGSMPKTKLHIVNCNKEELLLTFDKLSYCKVLNGKNIITGFFLDKGGVMLLSCYDKSFKEDIGKIIKEELGLEINRIRTCFGSNYMFYPDWSKAYYLNFKNNFNGSDYIIDNKHQHIVENLIETNYVSNDFVLGIFPNVKLFANKSKYQLSDHGIYISMVYHIDDTKYYKIDDYMKRYDPIRYFNTPTHNVDYSEYFKFSNISYNQILEAKLIYDPRDMFVTRCSFT